MPRRKRPQTNPRIILIDDQSADSADGRHHHQQQQPEEEADEDLSMAVNKRRRQFQIQNQWIPISQDSAIGTSTIVPCQEESSSDDSWCSSTSDKVQASQYRFQNYFTTPISARYSPLPNFNWADSQEVWQLMLQKEMSMFNVKNSKMFDRHPKLQSRMRAVLLDWLIEVCEVYKLHRETYYLAVDFIDRYLSKERNIVKYQLQLIGITALFIAAKLEEIYPPKLTEFSYVTDGACTENEILDQELVMLKKLKWDLTAMTVNSWLNMYLQVANAERIDEGGFVLPQYSSHVFIQIVRLIDLCMLDVGCLDFCSSVLTAAAFYHMSTQDVALMVSGFKWKDILPCVQWMKPFAMAVRETGTVELKFFPNVPFEDSHNIQTHAVDLILLAKSHFFQSKLTEAGRLSPEPSAQAVVILTPPKSEKKEKNKLDDDSVNVVASPSS